MSLTQPQKGETMTVTEQGFEMLAEIRKECGLDKEAEIEELNKPFKRVGRPPKCAARRRISRANPHLQPRPGEIQLKHWIANKAQSENARPGTIWERYYAGHYGQPELRRVNSRVIFVKTTPTTPHF